MSFYFTKFLRPGDDVLTSLTMHLDLDTATGALHRIVDYVQAMDITIEEVMRWTADEVKGLLRYNKQKARRVWEIIRPYLPQVFRTLKGEGWKGKQSLQVVPGGKDTPAPEKTPTVAAEAVQLELNDFTIKMSTRSARGHKPKPAPKPKAPAPAKSSPAPQLAPPQQRAQRLQYFDPQVDALRVWEPSTPDGQPLRTQTLVVTLFKRPFPLLEAMEQFSQRLPVRACYWTRSEMDAAWSQFLTLGRVDLSLLEVC